jgi:hypothetical protein
MVLIGGLCIALVDFMQYKLYNFSYVVVFWEFETVVICIDVPYIKKKGGK